MSQATSQDGDVVPLASNEKTLTTSEIQQQKLDRLAKERREQQVASRRGARANRQGPPPLITSVKATDAYPDNLLNKYLKCGFSDMQGRRPTMEDTLVIEPKLRTTTYTNSQHTHDELFVGVYDGHGGKEAAVYVKDHLHVTFKNKLDQWDQLNKIKQQIQDLYTRNEHVSEDLFHQIHQLSASLSGHVNMILMDKHNCNKVKMKKILQQESVLQILQSKSEKKSNPDASSSSSSSSSSSDEDQVQARQRLERIKKLKKKRAISKERSIQPIELYNMNDTQAIPLIMRNTFLQINESLCEERIKNGTTASIAYIRQQTHLSSSRQLYVANVGDSRVVLCRDGKAHRLTYDHRPNDIDEMRRVKDAGGTIVNNRVNAILAITRAIGDVYLHPMVTSDPYTSVVDLMHKRDAFVIVACDGLWDMVDDQEAVDYVKNEMDPRVASMRLRDLAYQKNSTDNISVVVFRITEPLCDS
ncbi:protein phosphatase 2C [Acrasis kona]|uniref:Protein phosphatase 2C n=1 Tax=Acrasis kona TaxID=1008807 RepID=A0AAW2Z5N6_9EUKA